MKTVKFLFLIIVVFLSIQACSRKIEKPNVLFIAVDDFNDWNEVLKGNPQARTPNFDRLASKGLSFTNAHCAAPACGPSRSAIMTGIRPSTSGNYYNPHSFILISATTKLVKSEIKKKNIPVKKTLLSKVPYFQFLLSFGKFFANQ